MCCLAIETLSKSDPTLTAKFNNLNTCHILEHEVTVADDLSGDRLSIFRRACVRVLVGIDELESDSRTDDLVGVLQKYKESVLVATEVSTAVASMNSGFATLLCECRLPIYLAGS
jgi:hypothetical protein